MTSVSRANTNSHKDNTMHNCDMGCSLSVSLFIPLSIYLSLSLAPKSASVLASFSSPIRIPFLRGRSAAILLFSTASDEVPAPASEKKVRHLAVRQVVKERACESLFSSGSSSPRSASLLNTSETFPLLPSRGDTGVCWIRVRLQDQRKTFPTHWTCPPYGYVLDVRFHRSIHHTVAFADDRAYRCQWSFAPASSNKLPTTRL